MTVPSILRMILAHLLSPTFSYWLYTYIYHLTDPMMYMHTVLILTYLVYIDGQYMASRISRSITKQTASIDERVQYSSSGQVSWEQVTDLSSSFWFGNDNSELAIPRTVRLQAINSLSKLHRASEEVLRK